MATFEELVRDINGGGSDQTFINSLFGSQISSNEVPIAAAGEAFREYSQQRQLANSIDGLVPNQSLDLFNLALDGDFRDIARQYGLNQSDVLAQAANQVTPFTVNQRAAQSANLNLGQSPLDPVYGSSIDVARGQSFDPFNVYQDRAGDVFKNQAENPFSSQENQAEAIYRTSAGQDIFQDQSGIAAGTLASTAAGDFVGSNPFLDAEFNRAANNVSEQFTQNILPSIQSNFASSGRYGSDAMQRQQLDAADLVGENITDLATGIYGGAYGQERGLQQDAANQLAALYGQGTSRQLQGASGLAGIGGTQQARALQAGSELSDLGGFGQDQALQAATLAPAFADAQFNAQLNNNNLVAGVGDQQQQLLAQLGARAGGYYNSSVNDDFSDLERLAGINSALGLTGAEGNGGVGQLQQSQGASAIGGALSGAALGASVGSVVPGLGTGIGAALGGGLGLIGGLL